LFGFFFYNVFFLPKTEQPGKGKHHERAAQYPDQGREADGERVSRLHYPTKYRVTLEKIKVLADPS